METKYFVNWAAKKPKQTGIFLYAKKGTKMKIN